MQHTTLSNDSEERLWQRTDKRCGGLLEWAMLEIDLQDADIPEPPLAQAQVITAQVVTLQHPYPRTKLTHDEAVAIYLAKLGPKSSKTAARLSAEFGITTKAVRDVWTKKTWTDHTKCVWTMCLGKDYIPTSPSSVAAAARVKRALQARPMAGCQLV